MARTTKAPVALVRDAGINAINAGNYTTIDATLVTNGLEITGLGGFDLGKVFLHVKNTFAGAKNVTVQSSDGGGYPADDYAGAGDVVVAVAASTGEQLICLGDSARYEQPGQAAEAIFVDFESGMTGSIAVFRLP